ncbi:TetR-like C-terminal domain-containing protein [Sorangium sp. So ce1078]
MLAVVQQAFAELESRLRCAVEEADDDPRKRLYAVCNAYLEFSRSHPERYRTMFGGLWMPTLGDSSLTEQDLTTLGRGALQILTDAVGGCVTAGYSTSTDPVGDAIALWLGLHGFAHQRAVSRVFPWPADIPERIITALAHLNT